MGFCCFHPKPFLYYRDFKPQMKTGTLMVKRKFGFVRVAGIVVKTFFYGIMEYCLLPRDSAFFYYEVNSFKIFYRINVLIISVP